MNNCTVSCCFQGEVPPSRCRTESTLAKAPCTSVNGPGSDCDRFSKPDLHLCSQKTCWELDGYCLNWSAYQFSLPGLSRIDSQKLQTVLCAASSYHGDVAPLLRDYRRWNPAGFTSDKEKFDWRCLISYTISWLSYQACKIMQAFWPQPPQAMSSRHKPPVSAWAAVFTTSLGCHHRMHLLESVHPNLKKSVWYYVRVAKKFEVLTKHKPCQEAILESTSYTHNASNSSIHTYSQCLSKLWLYWKPTQMTPRFSGL